MVVLVQETHQTDSDKLKLYGYTLADFIPSAHHGIATFIRNSVPFLHVGSSGEDEPTQWSIIEINNIQVVNLYHPPSSALDTSCLPAVSSQFIIAGDFNCRHETWGYPDSNTDGENLAAWSAINSLDTLFDPKQPASFHSGRWNRGTNPDIAFCTKINGATPVREVLNHFPRSQHRPSFISTVPLLTFTKSSPVPRWNFRRANWDNFKELTDKLAEDLPIPTKENLNKAYNLFTTALKTAAKATIPRGFRKAYIPTWDDECTNLYNSYLGTDDSEDQRVTANALIAHLDQRRQERWIEAVTDIDFTHSSRKAWSSINRLTGRTSAKKQCPVSPDDIAKQLVMNGMCTSRNKEFQRKVLRETSSFRYRPTLEEHTNLDLDFSLEEVTAAIKLLKQGKAPGPDGIHNEFLMHCGDSMVGWLTELLNLCYSSTQIPKMWRRASVISLLKPGKPDTSPKSYRPISLLCTTYKLMERLILTRINPIVDPLLPHDQAGFRQGRSTVDQVARLTQSIEHAFDSKLVTGAVFLDLTAAYDTVWHQGLRLKLQRMISNVHLTDFIMELLYTRSFVLFTSDGQRSRPHRLKNGVAQGSVLAPTLYNIYTSDFPDTSSTRYMYADDVALTVSATQVREVEAKLSGDMGIICQYLSNWRLKLSTTKTVSSIFHLRNHMATYELKVQTDSGLLNFDPNPTYLGVKLDRSLAFRSHLTKLKCKISARVALIRRLACTNWGASFCTLRTSVMALVLSAAEYCAPVWTQSAHTRRVDVPLHDALRLISGCIRSTHLCQLPFLSGIQPPQARRDNMCRRLYKKAAQPNHLLHEVLFEKEAPRRLSSRKPLRPFLENLAAVGSTTLAVPERLKPFIEAWSSHPPGSNLPRKPWVQLNRLRSGAGRYAANMKKWGISDSDLCPCGAIQTHEHVINECSVTGPPCPLTDIDDPLLVTYLTNCQF